MSTEDEKYSIILMIHTEDIKPYVKYDQHNGKT